MTNERPVYVLPLVNYNVYWPWPLIISIVWSHFLFGTIGCSLMQGIIVDLVRLRLASQLRERLSFLHQNVLSSSCYDECTFFWIIINYSLLCWSQGYKYWCVSQNEWSLVLKMKLNWSASYFLLRPNCWLVLFQWFCRALI